MPPEPHSEVAGVPGSHVSLMSFPTAGMDVVVRPGLKISFKFCWWLAESLGMAPVCGRRRPDLLEDRYGMMVDEDSFPMRCVSATMQFYHWGGMGAWPRGNLGMKFPASHYTASFTMLCLPESM